MKKGDKTPSKWAQSYAEVIRTVASLVAALGTLYLIGSQSGWW